MAEPSGAPPLRAALDGSDGLPQPRRAWAVFAVLVAVVVVVSSMALVNVALPFIAIDLAIDPATAVWIVSANQLAVITTLLPFAALGERVGYIRLFMGGLLGVAAASLVCAFAPNIEFLIAGRIVQGLATSAVLAINPALMRLAVPGSHLGRAIGLNAMTGAVTLGTSPVIGSFILTLADWHAVFLVNIPLAALAIGAGWRSLPRAPRSSHQPIDRLGTVLNMAAFGLIFASAGALAQQPAVALVGLAAGTVCMAWMVRSSLSASLRGVASVLPLDLLRSRTIVVCLAAATCAFAAHMGAIVSLPFLLHQSGRSVAEAGWMLAVYPLSILVMAPLAGRLADRYSARLLCTLGGALLTLGIGALASSAVHGHVLWFVMASILCGVGFGCFQTPNNRALMGAAPRARSGSAAGLQATARMTGQMLGTTATGLVFGWVASGAPQAALAVGAMLALVSAILSLWRPT